MRVRAYLLTFLAYAVMHSLRTGYSFSKSYFKVEYHFAGTFLAVLDSTIYFAMGIGFFLRYFFINNKDIVFSFFITGTAFITAFICFPLFSLTGTMNEANAQPISISLMAVYGFFQMNCWPVSFVVISQYFTNEEDGGLIGFWTAAGNLGNVLGYVFPPLLILSFHEPWQVPDLILASVLLLCTVGVYLFVRRKNQMSEQGYLELESSCKEQASFSGLLSTFGEMLSSFENALLIIGACLYKAIIYTFLLWLPILIDSFGEKADSAYISIIFNIANVAGASLIGKLYEKSSGGSSYVVLQYINPAMAVVLIGGVAVLYQLQTYSFLIYGIIIFVEGLVTGGIFNCLTSNELIKLAGDSSVKVDLYTTALFAASTMSVGLAQLMVGGFLVESKHPGEDMADGAEKAESYEGVFVVLLILAVLGFITISLRSYSVSRRISSMVDSS